MPTTWSLRPLAESDGDILRAATLMNVNWTGEERFMAADVDARPDFRHYVELRPARGDFGVVAESPGSEPHSSSAVQASAAEVAVAGAAWLVFLGADDPGYGFVAAGVPELSITVWPDYRGHGIGRALLTAVLAEAAARGIAGVSLSVESGNPAVHLYRSVGFVPVPGAADGTYVVRLAR